MLFLTYLHLPLFLEHPFTRESVVVVPQDQEKWPCGTVAIGLVPVFDVRASSRRVV